MATTASIEGLTTEIGHLQYTLDHIGAYVFTKDLHGRYTYANNQVCKLFGYPLEKIVGATDDAFFDLSAFNDLRINDRRVLDHGEQVECEETNVFIETGETRVYWSVKIPLRAADGAIVGLCGISTDITERRRMEAQIREQKLLLDTILNNIDAHVYMKDRHRRFLYVNANTAALFGCRPEDVVGKHDTELVPSEDGDPFNELDRQLLETEKKVSGEETFHDADGLARYYWSIKVPLFKDGEVDSYIGISTDISEIVLLKEEFRRLANTDEMTGISSRRHLLENATHELKRMLRQKASLSVIVFDIDNFKAINDSYGHATGDRAICAVVDACKKTLREIDLFGRLGGDEFVIISSDTDLTGALTLAERLRRNIASIQVACDDNSMLNLSASFGVTLSDQESSLDELLSHADTALYQAKRQGRNCVLHSGNIPRHL